MPSQEDVQERLLLADPADDGLIETGGVPATTADPRPSQKSKRPLVAWRLTAVSRLTRRFGQSAVLEAERGAIFLLAPVMICVGCLVYFAVPFEPGWPVALAPGLIALSVAWAARHREAAGAAALCVTLLCAGLLAAKVETWRASTRVIGGEITTKVTGRVELVEERENGRIRLTLSVLDTARPKLRYQPDRVRLTARKTPSAVRPGSTVTGVARLTQPLGPLRPGAYDFSFENYFDGIGATGFFLRDPVLVEIAGANGPGLIEIAAYKIEDLRNELAQRVRRHIGGDEGEIAAALIAGVRAGIPEKTNEVLRITGLAHVLSISGLHMALVAGVVIGAMRFVFALFPAFSSRYPVRKYAAAAALIAVAVYLLISGAAIAAQRSFLMIAVMLVALLFDRAALTMRNLAIAALVILAIAPHEAAGPSFQMSFAATAALIAAYGWWQHRDDRSTPQQRVRSNLVSHLTGRAALYAVGLIATALIAGSATGIFGAWHFQRVSPLGIPANLLTMPIVSVMVMPFAVLGVLLIPFQLDGPAFWVMGKGLEWMIAIAAWLAARTPLDAIGAIPVSAVILLSLALIPLTLATTTAWRATAVPLVMLGIASLLMRDLPTVFVSEDARLVAVRQDDGRVAVNRSRPNSFVMKDWRRAMMGGAVTKPAEESVDDALFAARGAFACRDGLCVIIQPGLSLAHARDMVRAEPACSRVEVIVIEDATAANPCPHSTTKVVTAKTFALRGSAEIKRGGEIVFALPETARSETARPWHDHRRFSRAARGMPPYVPKSKRPVQPAPASSGQQPAVPPDTLDTDAQ